MPPLMLVSGVRLRCEVDLPPLNDKRGVRLLEILVSVSKCFLFFEFWWRWIMMLIVVLMVVLVVSNVDDLGIYCN